LPAFHEITREGHAFQRYTLYILARYLELPLLKISYLFLRGRFRTVGKNRFFRRMLSLLVRPVAVYGDTARPVAYDHLIEHIGKIEGSIAVGPCRCRLVNNPCSHPLETDIVIRTGEEAFRKAFPRDYRVIGREEAVEIITRCHELGMFHMVFFHCPSTGIAEYAICNCCECGCVPFILNRELGQKSFPFFRGESVAVADHEKCRGHGKCVDACPFDARSVLDGTGATHNCYGCGLCVYSCPENAISLRERRPPGSSLPDPGEHRPTGP